MVLEDMCLGHTVADVMVILGSIDIVMGDVDRWAARLFIRAPGDGRPHPRPQRHSNR